MENNDELVEFLKEQIEVKDKQIEALNTVLVSFSQEKRSGAAVQISENLFNDLFAFHCQGKQDDPDLARQIESSLFKRQQVIARERFLAQN